MASAIEPAISSAARRYIEKMLRFLAPAAGKLDAQFRAVLVKRGVAEQASSRVNGFKTPRAEREARVRALMALTPAAASRLRTLAQFLEQVAYNGRRLARLNVPPEEVASALDEFGALVDPVFDGAFQPAREQLRLATALTLNNAYYEVRDAEAQTFFGLYRAETESASLEDALRGFVNALSRAVRARAGRLILREGGESARLAQPLYTERGGPDERLISAGLTRGRYASYWSYPVGETAAVQFAFSTRYPWLPRELSLVAAAANRCAAALNRARLENAVRRLHAEAKRAEEDERRRIGRELHDETAQSLLSLRLQLELLEREAPAGIAVGLREARQTAERAILEIRGAVSALSPPSLERLGLRPALRHLAARFEQTHRCALRLTASTACDGIPRPQAETVYRVAQECLQNVAKHSGAGFVKVSLRAADSRIRLSVADNGAGFRLESAREKPLAFGLEGMRERALLMGGTLAIRTAPGKGTRVILDLPNHFAKGSHHVENPNLTH